ncbi:hypothetical protein E1200_21660 [Actinomadura sp. GC306]|nr:hypothetical protein E1200_21660 [Actinomadura sp. GC306]
MSGDLRLDFAGRDVLQQPALAGGRVRVKGREPDVDGPLPFGVLSQAARPDRVLGAAQGGGTLLAFASFPCCPPFLIPLRLLLLAGQLRPDVLGQVRGLLVVRLVREGHFAVLPGADGLVLLAVRLAHPVGAARIPDHPQDAAPRPQTIRIQPGTVDVVLPGYLSHALDQRASGLNETVRFGVRNPQPELVRRVELTVEVVGDGEVPFSFDGFDGRCHRLGGRVGDRDERLVS